MSLLQTTDITKRKEVRFIVNNVHIHYGLREHTLISSLNCHNYPLNYKEIGSKKFHEATFQGELIKLEDVKANWWQWDPKMIVLFF